MHRIALRVGRFLERQGLLKRDAENSYLVGDAEVGVGAEELQSKVTVWVPILFGKVPEATGIPQLTPSVLT